MKDLAMRNEAYDFCMRFVSASKRYREQYIQKWEEILANFMVNPQYAINSETDSPYKRDRIYTPRNKKIVLKDPETHNFVMSYASKLVQAVMGDPTGEYIRCEPVGWEDAGRKAPTATRLLRYAFGMQGHFRTMVESIVDMIIFGTSIVEVGYRYEEREMLVRSVYQNGLDMQDTTMRIRMPSYDDACIKPVDVADFFPDPSRARIEDMAGCAKRFRMNALEARRMAKSGLYDSAAVEQAIRTGGGSNTQTSNDNFRIGYDQPEDKKQLDEFSEMVGYEYWGDVPWVDDVGSSRQVITVLNNVLVREDAWPLADYDLPFRALIINPVQGRFYGISPAEVVRYDQSFADALKMLLAEAIIREVHPPIAFDPDADPDLAALRAWRADALIGVRGGPASIGTVRYAANLQGGMAILSGIKNEIANTSGANAGIQGQPGPSRESASVGVRRLQLAGERPELAAMVLERECMPQIGRSVLRRYQQFLDEDGLQARVGEMPEPAQLSDIMGDFDIRFVGSRMAMSRQEKLQSYDRLVALSTAVPALQGLIPWQQIAQNLVGDILELPEVAAQIGNPQSVLLNTLLTQTMGQGAGGPAQNGVPQAPEPAGMMPEQAVGGEM